ATAVMKRVANSAARKGRHPTERASEMRVVVKSTDEEFNTVLTEYLHLGNLVDYFLFVQYTSAQDNGRKNIYYGKYKTDEPYFMTAWDLDGTFGNKWNGELADWEEDAIISNGFYNRMLALNTAGFNDLVCNRYGELVQKGIFDPASTRAKIQDQYDYLKHNGVYEREEERWPGSVKADQGHLDYTLDYLTRRANFLKAWTCDMSVPVQEPFVAAIRVYPNPTSNGRISFMEPVRQVTPWRLLDLAGRQLASGQLLAGQQEIDFGQQASGMYLLQIGEKMQRIVYR
ncbi:MAG: CotH kinase family protein, partial [Bacteroidota bacterium]